MSNRWRVGLAKPTRHARVRATARVVIGGALALGATFAVGSLLGTTAMG